MKVAYLILAHRNPKHIKRMVDALSWENSYIFLHIDAKSSIHNFDHIAGENVFFTDRRLPVYWAEYSMVEAILILMQEALSRVEDCDYYVLLSGSDYPLRTKEYIHSFFERMNGTQFISMARIPNIPAGLPLSKINKFRVPSRRPLYRFIVRALGRMHLANRDHRKYLGGLRPWGGHTWWALTRDACQHILKFAGGNPLVCKYFQNTATSDEMFFHTVLGNSAFARQVHRGLMYTDWPDPLHPKVITSAHVAMFEAQGKAEPAPGDAYGPGEMLFARKFSDDTLDLLDRIDEMASQKDLELKVQSDQILTHVWSRPTRGGV